jgi:hypothetical protein
MYKEFFQKNRAVVVLHSTDNIFFIGIDEWEVVSIKFSTIVHLQFFFKLSLYNLIINT